MTTKVSASMTTEGVTAAALAAKADASSVAGKADDSAVVKLTGDQTIAGTKTFSSHPAISAARSMVRLNTANGYGSTNTMIRRFTNTVTNTGSDITYADSATLGASFTINTAGVYAVSYVDNFTTGSWFGASLNASGLSTNVTSLAAAEVLAEVYTGGSSQGYTVSWTGYIPAGAVVRAHTNGGTTGATTNAVQFTIARVS